MDRRTYVTEDSSTDKKTASQENSKEECYTIKKSSQTRGYAVRQIDGCAGRQIQPQPARGSA